MCTKSIGFLEWARNCGDQADFEVEGMNHKKMVTKHFDLPNCLTHPYISHRPKQLKNSKVRLTLHWAVCEVMHMFTNVPVLNGRLDWVMGYNG